MTNTDNKTKKVQKLATNSYKKIALFGYFSLLLFMPLWLLVLNPSQGLNPWLSTIMFVLPLLFPLKGILAGNPYTFAWANFVVMLYFLHSLTTLWVSSDERIWAGLELIFASMMFYGGTFYAKYRGQELGLSLRKPKENEKV